jgi:hypothetical protein
VLGVGLASASCRQLNASHCGNQAGDLTCEQRDQAAPYCDRCEAVNDGCVAQPVSEPGCAADEGAASTASATSTGGDETSTSSDEASGTTAPDACGNGTLDEGEACDGEQLPAEAACADEGFGEGVPGCADDCSLLDYTSCPGYGLCGNGEVGFGEQCDGDNLSGQSCDSLPNRTGEGLACTAECRLDDEACQMCREHAQPCAPDRDACCEAGEACVAVEMKCCVPGLAGLCMVGG